MKTTKVASSAIMALFLTGAAHALPIRPDAGFTTNVLAPNDDGSTGSVALGFTADFFGSSYSSAFVNNNGNITFTAPLGTFTPFDLLSTSTPIIAPFFADVDTRGAGSSPVTYGTSIIGGQAAFGVNWVNVGFFSQQTNPLNSFQLVMIDRSDIGAGDFDFEFNYEQVLWETGQASGGSPSGLGGSSARAGWSNGVSASFELPGSAVNGALLNGGSDALISDSLNSNLLGRYVFSVRNGVVIPPDGGSGTGGNGVPDSGSTLALFGLVFALGCGTKVGKRLLKA